MIDARHELEEWLQECGWELGLEGSRHVYRCLAGGVWWDLDDAVREQRRREAWVAGERERTLGR